MNRVRRQATNSSKEKFVDGEKSRQKVLSCYARVVPDLEISVFYFGG